jgi:hypothetical protein
MEEISKANPGEDARTIARNQVLFEQNIKAYYDEKKAEKERQVEELRIRQSQSQSHPQSQTQTQTQKQSQSQMLANQDSEVQSALVCLDSMRGVKPLNFTNLERIRSASSGCSASQRSSGSRDPHHNGYGGSSGHDYSGLGNTGRSSSFHTNRENDQSKQQNNMNSPSVDTARRSNNASSSSPSKSHKHGRNQQGSSSNKENSNSFIARQAALINEHTALMEQLASQYDQINLCTYHLYVNSMITFTPHTPHCDAGGIDFSIFV